MDMTGTFSFTVEQEKQIRTETITTLMERGAPRADAEQVADLGIHMAQEALRRAETVASTIYSGHVLISASTLAFGLLHQRFGIMLEGSMAHAAAEGLSVTERMVKL